jgi:hypothetical protein
VQVLRTELVIQKTIDFGESSQMLRQRLKLNLKVGQMDCFVPLALGLATRQKVRVVALSPLPLR